MTYRSNITDKMRKYLASKLNCKNAIKFTDSNVGNNDDKENVTIKNLKIDSTPTSVNIISYNNENKNDTDKLKKRHQIYDFITEANYTGFEYFPYLYGVLGCHDKENSKEYVFYEYFEGTLPELINKIEHPSEWYDIVFQLAAINNFMTVNYQYRYDSSPENFLYNKLPKPIYQSYEYGTYKFSINHKFLIVLWGLDSFVITNDTTPNTNYIKDLLTYVENNKGKIKIPPSGRVLKLLTDLQNNGENTLVILDQYYNTSTTKPTNDSNI